MPYALLISLSYMKADGWPEGMARRSTLARRRDRAQAQDKKPGAQTTRPAEAGLKRRDEIARA
jgi:hypothetical protein